MTGFRSTKLVAEGLPSVVSHHQRYVSPVLTRGQGRVQVPLSAQPLFNMSPMKSPEPSHLIGQLILPEGFPEAVYELGAGEREKK